MPALECPSFEQSPKQILDETIESVNALDSMVFAISKTPNPTWETVGCLLAEAENKSSSLLAKVQILFDLNYTDETIPLAEELINFHNDRSAKYATCTDYQDTIKKLAKLRLKGDAKKWVELALEEVDQYSLPENERNRLLEIESRLNKITNDFNNNFQRCLSSWQLLVDDEKDLEGLRDELIARFAKNAKQQGAKGWLVTLSESIRCEILADAKSDRLRKAINYAWTTIATDQQPAVVNNLDFVEETLRLRHEQAQILGHKSFASYSLSDMNVTNPDRIIRLFKRLDRFVDKKVKSELKACSTHISSPGIQDVVYYLCRANEKSVETDIREYLNTEDTFHRMLDHFGKIFKLKFVEKPAPKGIHESNAFYEVYQTGELVGGFFTDMYNRDDRIDMCAVFRTTALGTDQLPVYFYILDYEETMSHSEFVIMLHEFGHLIHGLLNRCEHHNLGGYESLRLDGVEFMSQFMENFAWHKPTMRVLCRHETTSDPPPDSVLNQIIKDRTVCSGVFLQDYLKRALADLIMHHEYKDTPGFAAKVMLDVMRYNGIPFEEWNSRVLGRFHHTFGSVAGYESAYYIYIWSELFARDVFEKFARKKSIKSISEEMERFVEAFLIPTRENFPKLFKAYMGRPMSEKAWFEFYGLNSAS